MFFRVTSRKNKLILKNTIFFWFSVVIHNRKEDAVDADFILIRKMKQGDDKAFDIFVHKYYGDILK